jgi:hypothetical protein
MGLIVAGATSAGGLTALAVRLSRKKTTRKKFPTQTRTKGENENESSSQDFNSNSR